MASASSSPPLNVGIVLFPEVTPLYVRGPYEILARMPGTRVHFVAAAPAAISSERGLTIRPDVTFDTAPPLDVVCVPGGIGVNLAMEDQGLLRFLQNQARRARCIASVCTGALVLGAAGLLQGYRATTHWLSLDLLPLFGADPVDGRLVVDRNRITAAGVAAGLDLGVAIASMLFDAGAQDIQSMIDSSRSPAACRCSPDAAPADLVECVGTSRRIQSDRRIIAARAAALLAVKARKSSEGTADARESQPHALEAADGIAVDSLEPGTTLVVNTNNSQYRFVALLDAGLVLAKGGALFPEATIVRLARATAGGSGLKAGWILVGFHMEMWVGPTRIRSSRVRSVSIEGVPASVLGDGRARA